MDKVVIRWMAFALVALPLTCKAPGPEDREPRPASPQRQDLLMLNEAPQRGFYELRWGSLRVPIYKYGNPNVYGGEIEAGLNDLWRAMGGRLELFQGDRRLDFELIGINREPWSWDRRLWFPFPAIEKGLLEESVLERLRQAFHPGEQLQLRLRSADGAEIHPVTIRIPDPFAPYRPETGPGQLPDDGGVYGFQMVQYSGRPAILRIDTNSTATSHIYEMYRNDKSYRVLHVPRFRTRRRYLTERNELFQTWEIRRTELLCQEYDLLVLPEYTAYAGRKVALNWGKLEAGISSRNYRLAEFRPQQDAPLSLQIEEGRLPIRSFTLYISSKDNQPSRYIAENIREPAIQRALARLGPESTVYFDRLVVEDSSGTIVHFPGAFAFNIGEEPAYDLCITEVPAGLKPFAELSDKGKERRIHFSGIPLSDVIARLSDAPRERMLTEDLPAEPLLDVTFSSGKLSLAEAKALLMVKLQEAYRFTLEWPEEGHVYMLKVNNHQRWKETLGHHSPALPSGETSDQQETERLFSLARRIGSAFGISVADRTGYGGLSGRLPLDFSSVEKIRKSLKKLGLELVEAEGVEVIARF